MLTYDEISLLREHHSAWRLLRAVNAPLTIGFLGRVFVEENVRTISVSDLVTRLDDELHALRRILGEEAFPKAPSAYLADWATPESGWLRLYYPVGVDEPYVDATPALERAVAWVESLQERAFVGTESRLATLVDLLRQIVYGAQSDPGQRLERLQAERARIDEQIERARAGVVDVLGETAQRERYQQFAANARELLSDFREVETKFRALDRQMRETIAAWDGSKGELLDHVLGDRSAISDSDQGRSFHAFYDFLLSSRRQEELASLLGQAHALASVDPDPRVRRIDHDWLRAADRTQATVRQLSDQLRRFLDDRVWLENRRVMDLLRSIETSAMALRGAAVPLTVGLDALSPRVGLPFERPLYSRPAQASLYSAVTTGDDPAEPESLFTQDHVDYQRVASSVRAALRHTRQVALTDLVDAHPLEQGLGEVMAYLGLSEDGIEVVFDDDAIEELRWELDDGNLRRAELPAVAYVRTDVPAGRAASAAEGSPSAREGDRS